MNTKVSFGFDYLNIMANADFRSGNQNGINGYNLARVFLVSNWGLSCQEQDEANQLFWKALQNKSLENLDVVAERFVSHLKNDLVAKSRFITEMMILNFLDDDVTDAEREFTFAFARELDFRKSEVDEMIAKAYDSSTLYSWFGENYKKATS